VGAELGARFFCWYCKKSFNIMVMAGDPASP